VDHFLVDEWKRARTQKRGAGRIASLDAHLAEERFGAELADPRGADCVFGFDRDYALALLNTVMSRLEAEYQAQGRSRTFAILKPCLASDRAGLHHVDLAASLGVPVNTAKVLVHRMRRRCRELLREEVANTVSEPGEVDEELRHLLKVLAA
jgi:RNA polymerase sigma-70 factor (ECF subfamily)